MSEYRELSFVDTSSYFVNAYQWFTTGLAPITWSPLYSWFYGGLLNVSSDAFVVTTLHRWLIVFALAILVLAVMRRLLPHGAAWFAAAWWVVLPINFDALYEIHLFAVVPVLLATLIILMGDTAWHRGMAVAVLVAAAVLLRNEYLPAAGLLFTAFVLNLLWKQRSNLSSLLGIIPRLLLAYGLPALAAALCIFYFWLHASDASIISGLLERKHTLNICQTYTFGYEQRYQDFTKSPWTECQELMIRVYGEPEPSLVKALRKNPKAMLEHFLWNLSLFPNGLQVLLFNVSSGSVSPDYT